MRLVKNRKCLGGRNFPLPSSVLLSGLRITLISRRKINYSLIYAWKRGFLGSSAGKESTCNAGDPGSIPGSGRSSGEGIGYPLQCSWPSLVAQMVKNSPAMWETWVQSLGWEDPLEKEMATHSSILAWRIPWTVWSIGSQELDTTE